MTIARSRDPAQSNSPLRKRIRETLSAYKVIQSVDMEWSTAVRSGTMTYSKTVATYLQSQYRRWLSKADRLLSDVKTAQRKDQPIPGFVELRDAVGFCPAPFDIDAIAESLRRLDRGEGVRLTEAGIEKMLHRRAS
jgi:hypothetical protein